MVPEISQKSAPATLCKSCEGPMPAYSGMGQYRKYCTDECRDTSRNVARRSARPRPTTLDRFHAKTALGANDCIEWTGSKNDNGYGTLWVGGSAMLAHRFAYATFRGPIPESAHVLHRCDSGHG